MLVGGSVRAAAEDAAAGGYRVTALDHFGDADLLAVTDSWQRITSGIDWTRLIDRFPGPIVPTGGFAWPTDRPAIPPQVDNRRADRLIAFPTQNVYADLCQPTILGELALAAGIDFPITLPVDSRQNRSISDPENWLVKPLGGTGGSGIERLSVRLAAADRPENSDPSVIQRWVPGRVIGVNYFARFRSGVRQIRRLGVFAGLTERRNRSQRWLYGGSLGPFPAAISPRITPSAWAALERLGELIADRFSLVGLFNVDLILRPDGSLCLLEINPRYSASMELLRPPLRNGPDQVHEQTGPLSLIDWHLAAYQELAGAIETAAADRRTAWSTGESLPDLAPAGMACKRIVYATRPLRVDRTAAELTTIITPWLDELVATDSAGKQRLATAAGRPIQLSFHDLPVIGRSVTPEELTATDELETLGQRPLTSEIVPVGRPVLTIILRGNVSANTLLKWSRHIDQRLNSLLALS